MATITVGTNSYKTVAELETYATDYGITIAATDKTVLLLKAMNYLEVQQFKGYKTLSTQALLFPRVLGQSTYDDNYTDSDTVPTNIGTAQLVAAILIDGGEDLQPTIEKAVKREKIDVIEVEYSGNAIETSSYSQLDDLLRPFLSNSGLRGERI